MSLQTELEYLAELGVSYHLSVPSPWGADTFEVHPSDLVLLRSDRDSVCARHYKVSKEDYIAWRDSHFSVQCAGRTTRGTRCKNPVSGGLNVSAERWVQLQGEYCVIHGGEGGVASG